MVPFKFLTLLVTESGDLLFELKHGGRTHGWWSGPRIGDTPSASKDNLRGAHAAWRAVSGALAGNPPRPPGPAAPKGLRP